MRQQRLQVKRTTPVPKSRLLSTLLTYLPGAWIDPKNNELISLYRLRYKIAMEEERYDSAMIFLNKILEIDPLNLEAKLLLLTHAFESLGCKVVGLRTDNFNFASQRAIEALGAKKDGVIRHHHPRRDGTVRDSFMYSILSTEWPDVKRHLTLRLARGSRS